jgi:hypothetical protein
MYKLDVYKVIDGTDDWPLIDTIYGNSPEECEEKAEDKYGPNPDGYHWHGADLA